jgi:hypothetical protein
MQPVWTVTKHAPEGVQQAPVGFGQGLGVQSVPAPYQTFGAAQPASVVVVQTPSNAQQAPVG